MDVSDFPAIDPNSDYEKISPILQKRIVVFVNHFISNTVSFLNTFAQSCESRLMEFEYKVQKVEASLLILESQLASISGLSSHHNQSEEKISDVLELPEVKKEPSEATASTPTACTDPRFSKFFKMLQFGVPLQAVKNKMVVEGFDPDILDNPSSVVPGYTLDDNNSSTSASS